MFFPLSPLFTSCAPVRLRNCHCLPLLRSLNTFVLSLTPLEQHNKMKQNKTKTPINQRSSRMSFSWPLLSVIALLSSLLFLLPTPRNPPFDSLRFLSVASIYPPSPCPNGDIDRRDMRSPTPVFSFFSSQLLVCICVSLLNSLLCVICRMCLRLLVVLCSTSCFCFVWR